MNLPKLEKLKSKYFDSRETVYRFSECGNVEIEDLPHGTLIYSEFTNRAGMPCIDCAVWQGKMEVKKTVPVVLSFEGIAHSAELH